MKRVLCLVALLCIHLTTGMEEGKDGSAAGDDKSKDDDKAVEDFGYHYGSDHHFSHPWHHGNHHHHHGYNHHYPHYCKRWITLIPWEGGPYRVVSNSDGNSIPEDVHEKDFDDSGLQSILGGFGNLDTSCPLTNRHHIAEPFPEGVACPTDIAIRTKLSGHELSGCSKIKIHVATGETVEPFWNGDSLGAKTSPFPCATKGECGEPNGGNFHYVVNRNKFHHWNVLVIKGKALDPSGPCFLDIKVRCLQYYHCHHYDYYRYPYDYYGVNTGHGYG